MAVISQIKVSSTTYDLKDTEGRKEAYLEWGGKNFTGGYGCIDAAMVDELGANRLMFAKAAGITAEYSRDGGSTWTDYGATNDQKLGLFSNGYNFVIGKADSTNKATANGTNYQLRITIDTGAASVYTVLNKFVFYVSTNGSNECTVTIQKALQNTPTTYVNVAENIGISGWSGYNVVNVSSITTYGNNASSQYGRLRFIFKANGGNTSYNGLSVSKIMGFGGVGWTTPSTMAKTGHLYSFDQAQNATFPAKVTATSFSGNLTGNASTATSLASGSIYSLSSKDDLNWDTTANRTKIPNVSAIAYWNGAYEGTNSNLSYCNRGAFGTIITKATGDYLASTGGTVSGTLILSRTTDASGTANNKPALIVGGTDTQAHIEIDANEIISKTNGTTQGTLYLQDSGGAGIVDVNGTGGLNVSHGNLTIGEGKDLIFKAGSSATTDPGDLLFQNSSGTEIGRIYKQAGQNAFFIRYSSSGTPYKIYTAQEITSGSAAPSGGTSGDIYFQTGTTQDGWTTLWTGALQGSKTQAIAMDGYSKLRIWCCNYSVMYSFLVDLTTTGANTHNTSYPYYGGGTSVIVGSGMEIHGCTVGVNAAKSTLYNEWMGYHKNSGANDRNSNASYYIYKVEGCK